MAPTVPGSALLLRGLGDQTPFHSHLTSRQIFISGIVMLISASISLLGGIIVLFWFLRMRRSYRHHLIMLLILSDMFKAMWFLIPASANFLMGVPSSTSTFCQAAGFFLAFGTEASDFAILMIAVHAALYIFRPTPSLGEAGLYHHRYLAYATWLFFPALMASLAFVNPTPAYVQTGSYCYLPPRPFWYRLALNWIPRYIILLTILGLYLSIYIFVAQKFNGLLQASGGSYKLTSHEMNDSLMTRNLQQVDQVADATPWAPLNASHGKLPGTNTNIAQTSGSDERPREVHDLPERPVWEEYTFGSARPITQLDGHSNRHARDIIRTELPEGPSTAPDVQSFQETPGSLVNDVRGGHISNELVDSLSGSLELPQQPQMSTLLAMRDGNADTVPMHINQTNHTSSDLRQRHSNIKRQIRILFIYPVVYLLMWIVPFVYHCFLYSDYYVQNPPFVLYSVSTAILALQCAVDCILFSIREKPWRSINDENGSRPCCLASRRKDSKRGSMFQAKKSSAFALITFKAGLPGENRIGRRKGEMVAEARNARARRDLEGQRERKGMGVRDEQRKASLARRGGREDRSWWEVEGKRRSDSVMLGMDSDVGGHPSMGMGMKERKSTTASNTGLRNVGSRISESRSRLNANHERSVGTMGEVAETEVLEYPGMGMLESVVIPKSQAWAKSVENKNVGSGSVRHVNRERSTVPLIGGGDSSDMALDTEPVEYPSMSRVESPIIVRKTSGSRPVGVKTSDSLDRPRMTKTDSAVTTIGGSKVVRRTESSDGNAARTTDDY